MSLGEDETNGAVFQYTANQHLQLPNAVSKKSWTWHRNTSMCQRSYSRAFHKATFLCRKSKRIADGKAPDRRRGATSQCGHSASTSKNDAKFQGNIHCRFFTPRPGVSFHKTGQWAKTAGLGLQPSLNEVLRLSLSGTGCI